MQTDNLFLLDSSLREREFCDLIFYTRRLVILVAFRRNSY